MVRIRSGLLVAIVALGLGAAGCKKSDDNKGGTPTADKTAEKMGGDKAPAGDKPAAGGAISGQMGDDLSLLPVDSEVVMGINIAQLQQSALWKQFSPKLMEKMAKGLADFKAACGLDRKSTRLNSSHRT